MITVVNRSELQTGSTGFKYQSIKIRIEGEGSEFVSECNSIHGLAKAAADANFVRLQVNARATNPWRMNARGEIIGTQRASSEVTFTFHGDGAANAVGCINNKFS